MLPERRGWRQLCSSKSRQQGSKSVAVETSQSARQTVVIQGMMEAEHAVSNGMKSFRLSLTNKFIVKVSKEPGVRLSASNKEELTERGLKQLTNGRSDL